jgi:hypothetical protein
LQPLVQALFFLFSEKFIKESHTLLKHKKRTTGPLSG